MKPLAFGLVGVAMLAIVSIVALAVAGPWPDASADDVKAPGLTIEIEPREPRVGDIVEITSSGQHLSQFILPEDLFITQPEPPVLEILGERIYDVWTLEALRPGTASVQTRGTFEKHFACPTPEDFCGARFYYVYSWEPVVVVHGSAGDADCDATLQSLDALLILEFAAALVESLPCGDASDMNEDCVLDALDAVLILQVVASLIPEREFQPC